MTNMIKKTTRNYIGAPVRDNSSPSGRTKRRALEAAARRDLKKAKRSKPA